MIVWAKIYPCFLEFPRLLALAQCTIRKLPDLGQIVVETCLVNGKRITSQYAVVHISPVRFLRGPVSLG